jgi:hypothetical protein
MKKTNETVGGGLLTTVTPTTNGHLLSIKTSGAPSNLIQQMKTTTNSVTSTPCVTLNGNHNDLVPPAALRALIPVCSASVCGINTSTSNVSVGGDRNNNLKRALIQQQHAQSSSLPTANVISLVLDVSNSTTAAGGNGQRSTINFIEPSLPRPIGCYETDTLLGKFHYLA